MAIAAAAAPATTVGVTTGRAETEAGTSALLAAIVAITLWLAPAALWYTSMVDDSTHGSDAIGEKEAIHLCCVVDFPRGLKHLDPETGRVPRRHNACCRCISFVYFMVSPRRQPLTWTFAT
mmetsp:Transcript_436/g.1148  ORF Transcript_436/g.1148 Transcript_436/m.1148 type:complete len:121 (-) Transcript_436:10-372(-)